MVGSGVRVGDDLGVRIGEGVGEGVVMLVTTKAVTSFPEITVYTPGDLGLIFPKATALCSPTSNATSLHFSKSTGSIRMQISSIRGAFPTFSASTTTVIVSPTDI